MKTKLWELLEFNEDARNGDVKESDIVNGIKDHLAILCPDCGSKLWKGTISKHGFIEGDENDVVCKNCHFTAKREMAK
jgi:hypothetical protein